MTPSAQYNKGEIIRLSESCFERHKSDFYFSQNLFVVEADDGNNAKLCNLEIDIPSHEILPVKIDGIEDRDIYYDPVVAADVVGENSVPDSHILNKGEYYLDKLKSCYTQKGESYYDRIRTLSVKYVHELQRAIPFIGRALRINYKIQPFIERFPHKAVLNKIAHIITYKKYISSSEDWRSYCKVFVEKDITSHRMVAYAYETKQAAYVLLFKEEQRAESTYSEFYLNSSIGKISLLKDFKGGKIVGRTSLQQLKKADIRWVDRYKECCIYLEALIQMLSSLDEKLSSKKTSLLVVLGFLSQLRDAIVLEMILPKLFQKAHISIIEKWKEKSESMVQDFFDSNKEPQQNIEIIEKLLDALMASDNSIINEMSKFRLYMSEFIKFANQNSDLL